MTTIFEEKTGDYKFTVIQTPDPNIFNFCLTKDANEIVILEKCLITENTLKNGKFRFSENISPFAKMRITSIFIRAIEKYATKNGITNYALSSHGHTNKQFARFLGHHGLESRIDDYGKWKVSTPLPRNPTRIRRRCKN